MRLNLLKRKRVIKTAYIAYQDYVSIFGANLSETDFNRLEYEAEKRLEHLTTGIDGVNKLKYFFPTDESDAEAIKHCLCAIVNAAYQIEQISNASGVVVNENGTITGKSVVSMSSGSESISFSSASSGSSVYAEASKNLAVNNQLVQEQSRIYLSGVKDSNGVNLLYLGAYPYVQKNNNAF